MGSEDYEPPKRGVVAAAASWVVPLWIVWAVCGFVFAKRVTLSPWGLSFGWTSDEDFNATLNAGFFAVLLVVLVVAFIVIRRKRRDGTREPS